MSVSRHWILSGWYPRGLLVHQQRYRHSDSNKNKNVDIKSGTYKVRNEIETKRNDINENETKWNETKSTKTKRNETKRNQQKRNETKRNQRNENEIKTKPTKAKRNQRKQNEIENRRKNNRDLKEIKPIFTITMLDYFPHMSVFHQERTGFVTIEQEYYAFIQRESVPLTW